MSLMAFRHLDLVHYIPTGENTWHQAVSLTWSSLITSGELRKQQDLVSYQSKLHNLVMRGANLMTMIIISALASSVMTNCMSYLPIFDSDLTSHSKIHGTLSSQGRL